MMVVLDEEFPTPCLPPSLYVKSKSIHMQGTPQYIFIGHSDRLKIAPLFQKKKHFLLLLQAVFNQRNLKTVHKTYFISN